MLGSKSDRFPMIRKYVVLLSAIFSNTKKLVTRTLREKCPNTDFFSGPYLDNFHAVVGIINYLNNYVALIIYILKETIVKN